MSTIINPKYQNQIFKQDYTSKTPIAGVKFLDIPYFSDDGGSFCELLRMEGENSFKEHFPDFELKQMNWSVVESGLIKAGHVHKNQDDIWFVPPTDKVIVGLMDIRDDSSTKDEKMRFVMGAGKARLLYIPRGVVHGCSNPYSRPMTLLYLVNNYWTGDPEKTDEYRINYKVYGPGFWEIAKG